MDIGTLSAGSTMTVDTETFTMSDPSEVSGSLPAFGSGTNTVQYSDGEANRDVTVEIVYKPRYL